MTAPGAALRALEALAAATGEPPASDAAPDDVLASGEALLAGRERLIAELQAAAIEEPDALRGPDAAALRAGIEERSAAWMAALSRARHEVGERVHSVARIRRLSRR